MQLAQSIKAIIVLTVVLMVFAGYQFTRAQWAGPTATAPGNNVSAPINTGSASQTKSGVLGVDGLAVFGLTALSGDNPKLNFTDTAGGREFQVQNIDNSFVVRSDRNSDSAYDSTDFPTPVIAYSTANGANDYFQVANSVRANEYCNRAGTVCFTPAQNDYRCVTTARETETKPFIAGSNPRIGCSAGNFNCMSNWCQNNGWDNPTIEAACTGSFCVFSCVRAREVCGYY